MVGFCILVWIEVVSTFKRDTEHISLKVTKYKIETFISLKKMMGFIKQEMLPLQSFLDDSGNGEVYAIFSLAIVDDQLLNSTKKF